MLSALKTFLTPSSKQQAYDAYLSIVTAARNPVFYTDWQVPDTLDGRFDIIVLHLFLVLQPCEKDEKFCLALSELFFADMDRSLREMGVGDTGVGKRIKNMAQAFYGRMKAYASAIGDDAALRDALRRNVWREQPVADEAVGQLAAYARRNYQRLCTEPADTLLRGQFTFLR
jgi:cytochrome b pre-mRNA-processing protein 3